MADQDLTQQSAQTTWSADDLMYVVDDPSGTPADKKMTLDDLFTEIVTGVVVKTTNGIDVTPGSDTDADLLTVNVTGTPKLWWDESADSFVVNDNLQTSKLGVGVAIASNSVAKVGGTSYTEADLRAFVVDVTNDGASTHTLRCYPRTTGSANLTDVTGAWTYGAHGSSGTLSNIYNYRASFDNNGGAVTARTGYLVHDAGGAGTVATQYGVRVVALSKGSTNWAIHVGTNNCHFEGAHEFINSSAPSGVTDGAHIYAADQAAGNSCIHVRAEGGATLKLFQGAAIADAGAGEAETQLNLLLAHLRAMGVIAT